MPPPYGSHRGSSGCPRSAGSRGVPSRPSDVPSIRSSRRSSTTSSEPTCDVCDGWWNAARMTMEPMYRVARLGRHDDGLRRGAASAVNVLSSLDVRTSRPGVPAARSWGSGRRARGTLVACLVGPMVLACGGTGPTVSPSVAPSRSSPVTAGPSAPTTVIPSAASPSPPSASASPSPSDAGLHVDNAEAAIAAVGRFDPRFLGYRPQQPGAIGDGPHVIVEHGGRGWVLTFVTGSGDCPAGCISHAYAKFSVTQEGIVTLLCTWETESGGASSGTEC